MYNQGILILAGYFMLNSLSAQVISDTVEISKTLNQVTVTGEDLGSFTHLPGSVKQIGIEEITRMMPHSGNEVMKKVTGLNVVEEEGAGLRMNIGIRGLDPDRSRTVLVLEDGIPVSLNPYGENELYYTPPIDRMSGVEVLKGSGQILFGPQTIGGVVNYLTADPTAKPSLKVRFMGGRGLHFNGFAQFSTSFKNTGITISYLRNQADNMGPTRFRLNDFNLKLKTAISKKSELVFKGGFYQERSNSTYIGITQTMYDAGGQDYVRMAPDDELKVSRYSASLAYSYKISRNVVFSATAFGYTTRRDWRRQDFVTKPGTNMSGTIWGDTTVTGGAVYMQKSATHRNRQFNVLGAEAKFSGVYGLGKMRNKFDVGVRYMHEKAFEQQLKSSKPDAASGALTNMEERPGQAISVYGQNKMFIRENLTLTVGVRGEFYHFSRNIFRTSSKDTLIQNEQFTAGFIPGAGINYRLGKSANLFAGVHRGFAPPRVKDAISNNGEVYQLKAENSWNYELGARIKLRDYLMAEVTGFYMDFSNQVIPVSQSSGGSGAGLVNGGATRHIGAETGIVFMAGKLFKSENWILNLDVNFTFTDSRFSADRRITSGADTVNIRQNFTPYAPRVLLNSSLTFQAPFGLGARLTAFYTGKQFADEENTVMASADGRVGEIPAYFLMDGSLWYTVPKSFTTFRLSVKNMTNNRYIASRRPQGIRVGLPVWITGGFEFSF